jgi:hypothetical protein
MSRNNGCDGCWENSNYPQDQCTMDHDKTCPSSPDYLPPPSMPKLKSGWYKLKGPNAIVPVPIFPCPAPFVFVEP